MNVEAWMAARIRERTAVEIADAQWLDRIRSHRATPPAPYTGPIRLGRRDEEITHGRD